MSHKQEGHKIRNVVIAVGCTATPVQTAASVINTTEFELLFPWSAGFVFFLPSFLLSSFRYFQSSSICPEREDASEPQQTEEQRHYSTSSTSFPQGHCQTEKREGNLSLTLNFRPSGESGIIDGASG